MPKLPYATAKRRRYEILLKFGEIFISSLGEITKLSRNFVPPRSFNAAIEKTFKRYIRYERLRIIRGILAVLHRCTYMPTQTHKTCMYINKCTYVYRYTDAYTHLGMF
jgi:hypothetical protein